MKYSLVEVAYAALLHDIGKFYQRIYTVSNLNVTEIDTAPLDKYGNYHTHLHSGYTSRFFSKYLNQNNEYELLTSEHHKKNSDEFSKIIRDADHIASAIDRSDEHYDFENNNKKGQFIISRLHSVMSEVDFGTDRNDMTFPLSTLKDMTFPQADYSEKTLQESSDEYKYLFEKFIKEVENSSVLKKKIIDINNYHKMYNLLNQYCVTIPASTFEGKNSSVSLFDHLKLTSAIASCLYYDECQNSKEFYMLELDISGIQNFIYQITEGVSGKEGLTKALRGRSIFVGLITNAITYAFLKLFGLTESNILFNTGGGAVILLPYTDNTEEKVDNEAKKLQKKLFDLFKTEITFVYGLIKLTETELATYQSDKALELKQEVGRNKMRKFYNIIDEDFFFQKINSNNECYLCGRPVEHKGEKCHLCKMIEIVSDVYIRNNNFGILYDYDKLFDKISVIDQIDLGFVKIKFVNEFYSSNNIYYIDSINSFGFGNQKLLASLVPKDKFSKVLNFESIVNNLIQDKGDSKLGILKMDVDNLGGIFAFGLKQEGKLGAKRSISKYVTLSRLIELFFGHYLVEICRDVSLEFNSNIHQYVENQTMFYINYAGGDDLVIMGPAYGIVYLAKEINKRFENYTGNKGITISGGIHIQGPKSPIRFGVGEAEKQLEYSKQGKKHAITLMNTTISFEKYDTILNKVEDYVHFIQQGKISRTMIYNIMSNIRDKDYKQFIYFIPRIQYILFRNLNNKDSQEIFIQMKKDINDISNDRDLQEYILILKLTIMFTRNTEREV